jgi:L-galactose dehydrogenase
MKYREMGSTGWQISEVSLGGAYLMGTDPERAQESTNEVLRRALELGINYIDTAPLYGKSEELLGGALEAVAEHFYVATKVGYDPPDFDYRGNSVLWSIERSLQRLRIPKLAIAQIHEVNMAGWDRITEPGGTLEGLKEAQKRGLCERIGITGRAIPLLAKLADTGEFDTMLVYHDYHPCSQRAAKAVIPSAAAHNMGVVIATPLAGLLFADEPRRSEAVAGIEDEAEQRRVQHVLGRLQDVPGTLAQNSFQYILADSRVTTVSSGAANISELEDVAQASEMGPLLSSLCQELNQIT